MIRNLKRMMENEEGIGTLTGICATSLVCIAYIPCMAAELGVIYIVLKAALKYLTSG